MGRGTAAAGEGSVNRKLFGSKILANLAPSATWRKGKTAATSEFHVDPEVEAHLCQLAMMENYASHPMYVKFSDEEANALEDRSLQLALAESKADEEALRLGRPRKQTSGSSSLASQPYTPTEVHDIISLLQGDDDPFFWDAFTSDPRAANEGTPPTDLDSGSGDPPPPPSAFGAAAKISSFAAFKRKILPSKDPSKQSGRGLGKLFSRRSSSGSGHPAGRRADPDSLVRGYSPGTDDHFQAEATERGLEYINGYVFPAAPTEEAGGAKNKPADERMDRVLADSGARQSSTPPDSDETLMSRALKESRIQGELDEALREAKTLRLDLGNELERCRAKLEGYRDQTAAVDVRINRLAGKQKTPLHLRKELAESKHHAQETESRVAALEDAVDELGHLEGYVKSMRPSKNDAIGLAEVITRQLLERLNFMGFEFHVPSQQQGPQSEIDVLLAKFRELNPVPDFTPTATPNSTPPPSPAPSRAYQTPMPKIPRTPQIAPSPPISPPSADAGMPSSVRGAGAAETGLQELDGLSELSPAPSTPVRNYQPSVLASPVTTPSPSVNGSEQGLPPLKSWASINKASHRLQRSGQLPPNEGLGVNGSRPQNDSSVAESIASWSTASTGQRIGGRRPLGPLTAKRSSQVVHLYAELRKVMPETMEVSYATAEPLRPGGIKLKLMLADSDAPNGTAEFEAIAEAERHAQLLEDTGLAISTARPPDMTALRQFVADMELQLQPVDGEHLTVLAHAPNFPKAKWRAFKDAAGLSIELQEFGNRMRSWAVGQGSFQEEATVMEVFFDTVRVRVTEMQTQVKGAERRWAIAGIPWNDAAFKECRVVALHLATLFMSQALIAVANLERAQTLKAEACIQDLATSVRIAYKVHQFVGGFHSDAVELFEKIKRLTQYYVRSRDPTWLKDTTKFTH